MKNVLITGSNGFIGSHLYRYLKKQNIAVKTLNRHFEEDCENAMALDLAASEWMINPCEGVDTVFHLAGKAHALSEVVQDDAEYRQINTDATRRLLENAKQAGVKRFVFFSSVKAVADSDSIQDELNFKMPDTPYGISKREAEKLVLEGNYVEHPVVIRPCMVYGNTDKGNLPRMIRAIAKGFFPPLPEVHNQRSMIHVDDVIQAAFLAANDTKAAGQVYIVTDGTPYSTRQIYDWIRKALGKKTLSLTIPLVVLNLLAKSGDKIGQYRGRRFIFDSDALDKLIGSACYSSAKIEKELGFVAQRHLQQSLFEIVEYLQKNAKL